ncbi:MAG: STAS domain-containing protein [Rhodocyclaceae bacterium]
MSGFRTRQDEAGALALEGEITVFHAHAVKDAVLAHVALDECPVFDLSAVSDIDSSGVQLLLLARREAACADKRLRWQAHSHAVLRALETLNLGHVLDAPATLLNA